MVVDHRRVAALVVEQAPERVAHDVVEVDPQEVRMRRLARRDAIALGQRALGQPAQRPAVVVDHQRDRQVGLRHLRAHVGQRVPLTHERALPQVDVAHALERQALERAVGADELLDVVVGRVDQQLGRRGVLGQAGRPPA